EVLKATSEDYAKDVMTSMNFLKTRKEIDKNKIGLIGHSEGGLIASIIITQRKDVSFIISLAGVGMKGADILADQGELIMRREGVDSATAKAYSKLYRKIIALSLLEHDTTESTEIMMMLFSDWKKTVTQ